ncbi:MAG TPA: thioredoxin family protein [Burkholderiaceae bacterium]|nr:thioredoxin family protein [Burkholderiaceae bacterium]
MAATPSLTVACLCAAWCRTCDDYRRVFAEVARAHVQARFVWIDIEEHSDVLGEDLDVENFPTLALLREADLRFFGTVLPHAATLDRMVEAALADSAWAAGVPPAAQAMAGDLHALSLRLPPV